MDIPYDFTQFGKNIVVEETKEKKVLIKIPLNDGYWTKEYNKDVQILDLIKDFKEENQLDISRSLLNKYLVSGIEIDENDKVQALLNTELFLNNFLNKKFRLIGKPFNNPFEVFVFDKTTKILNVQTFNATKVNSLGLNHYGPSSSYCNGNNHLYISGGETNSKQLIDKFYDIDLESKDIDGPYDMSPKANHSMIYISPDKVFIVGGNDLKTFYFDIRQRKIIEWADLNLIRIEPALQIFGKALFCFDNVNKNNNEKLTFEKTDLSNTDNSWELIEPDFDQSISSQKLAQKFFAVSKDSTEENIIFLGGNMDDSENSSDIKNYKYNPNLNNIEITDIPFKDFNYKEKTFLFYNKNVDYLLPDFNRQHPEVTFYVKNKSKFEKVNYLPSRMPNQSINIIPHKRILLKYNFDMPNKENIGKNLKTHININNQNNPINEMKIPNIGNINIKTDLGIPKIKPYEEPDIQPNIGDKQINLQIPPKMIGFNKPIFEEEKNAEENQDFTKNIKISVNPDLDGNFNLLHKSKQNLNDSKIQINVEVDGNENNFNLENKNNIEIKGPEIKLNNDIIDINIHQSVDFENDGLELLEDKLKYKKGEIITNNEFGDFHLPVKQSLNIKEIQLNQKNIENPGIPEYNSNIDLNIDAPKINVESPEVNVKSPNIKVESPEVNVKSPNIKVESPEVNVEPPKVNAKMPEIKLRTNNSEKEGIDINTGIKKENLDININTGDKIKYSYYDTGLIKGKDFDLKKLIIDENEMKQAQDIYGSANINIRGPKLDIDQNEINNPNLNYNLDTKAKGPDIKADIKIPEVNISGNIPNGDLKGPNLKIDNPNINIPDTKLDVNINKPEFEMIGIIQGSDYNIIKNDINLNLPNINKDIKGDININGPKVEISSPEISGPNLKGKNININKPDINIKADTKLPEANISGTLPKVDIKGPNVNIDNPNINIPDTKLDVNINKPEFEMIGIIQGSDYNIIKNDINLNLPNINKDIKGDININGPKVEISSPEIAGPNLKGKNININKPDINIKADTKLPEANISGTIPKVDINGPNVNIDNPNINIPDTKLDVNINKPEFEMIGIIQGSDYNIIKNDINLNLPNINKDIKGDININGPKVEISSPEIEGPNLKGKNININKPDINLNLDGNLPDGDIGAPKVGIGNFGVDINGQIPDVDINKPKVDMNIKSPELNIGTSGLIPGKDFEMNGMIKGPDNKIEMPKINLDGKAPDINVNVNGPEFKKPDLNYNMNGEIKAPGINIDTPNINTPKIEVSQKIPGIDIKGPKIDINKPIIELSGVIRGADFDKYKDLNIEVPNIDSNIGGGIDLKGPKVEISSPNIEGPDVKLKGKNIDIGNPNVNAKLDVNLPETKINSPNINTGDIDANIKGSIPKVELNGPKIDVDNKLNLPDANINVNAPNVKIPENYSFYEVGLIKGKDFELTGLIKDKDINGSTNLQMKGNLPNIDIKGKELSKPELNYNIDGKGIDIKGDVNIPNGNISGNIPKLDVKGPSINVEAPSINAPKVDINKNIGNVDIKGPNINIDKPEILMSGFIPGADFNFETKDINVNLPNINKNVDLNVEGPKIDGPNIDLKGKKLDINKPEVKMNVEGNIFDAELKKPKIDINKPDINLDINKNINKVDINVPDLEIKGGDIKSPDVNFELGGIIPSDNIGIGNGNLKGSRKLYDYNINMPDINQNINPIKLDNYQPNLELKGSRKLDVNLNKNIEGKIPSINLNGPNFKNNIDLKGSIKGAEISEPNLNANINMPSVNIPSLNINGKNDFEITGIIKGANYQNLDLDIKGPKADINIKKPDVDIKGPSINIDANAPKVKGPNIDIKAGYDFYTDGTILGAEDLKLKKNDKNIDINLTKPKIDIKSPEIKIGGNVKKPDIDINNPELKIEGNINKPKIDINNPEIKIEGNNNQIKIPDINLNGANINVPGVELDTNMKNINMPSGDINIKENIDIKAPKIEVPSGDVKLNAPNINGPNINITGDSKNLNFNGPELNAKIGDIKIKNPQIKADANLKVDDININNKLNPEINPGKVNIKLDLPKNKENCDFYLEGTILGVDSKKEKEEKQKVKISKNLEIDNSINLKGSRRLINPEYSINSPNVGLKSSQIRIQQPDINLKGLRRIDNYNPNINDNIKGSRMLFNENDIPENTTGIKIKPPTIEINPGNININESSQSKIKGTIGIPNINANIETKNEVNIPAPGQMVNIEIKKFNLLSEQNNDNIPPNNEVKNSANDVKINMPQINVNLNTNIEGNDGKINKTYVNKRGNALPKVGNKETGFKASKVEKGGKFDTDNVNTELLKNVNVGVGGVKMGERIEE